MVSTLPPASDASCAINSLALKYLSYEDLGRDLQPSIAGRARNLGARRPDQLNTACYGLVGGPGQGVAGKYGQD